MRIRLSVSAGIIAGVLGLGLSGPSFSAQDEDFDYDTTEDLYQVCTTSTEDPEHAAATLACRAFIEATVQYHDAISGRKRMKRLICYPATATIADGRSAFVGWAKANMDDGALMGEQPVLGLVRALADEYPCK